MSIASELFKGTIEYKDNGDPITHAPTSLALRAGRLITTLEAQHQNHVQHIQMLQRREEEDALARIGYLNQIAELNEKIKGLTNELQSLRDSAEKTVCLDSGGCGNPRGSEDHGSGDNRPEDHPTECTT